MKLGTLATVAALEVAMMLGAAVTQAGAGPRYRGDCNAWLKAANDAAARGDKVRARLGRMHFSNCLEQGWKHDDYGKVVNREAARRGVRQTGRNLASRRGAELILGLGLAATALSSQSWGGGSHGHGH